MTLCELDGEKIHERRVREGCERGPDIGFRERKRRLGRLEVFLERTAMENHFPHRIMYDFKSPSHLEIRPPQADDPACTQRPDPHHMYHTTT